MLFCGIHGLKKQRACQILTTMDICTWFVLNLVLSKIEKY